MRIKLTFWRVTAVLALAYPLSRSLDIVQMLRVRDYGSVAVLLGVSVVMAPIIGAAAIYLIRRLKPDLLQ